MIDSTPEQIEERQNKLDALGITIAGKRDEAVAARKESGIELVWQDCEEAYLGIDDANRGEFAKAKWAKPTSMEAPVTTNRGANNNKKSTAFVRMTSRYVDMGSAKLAEILLPIDDKAFSLEATPVPDLVKFKDDLRGLANRETGEPVMRDQTPEEQAQQDPATAQPGAAPVGSAPQVQMTVADLATQKLAKASESAEKAETRIHDWMIEANYSGETRKVVFDAARLGAGVLMGPVPAIQRSQAIVDAGNGNVALERVEKVAPDMERIDLWDFFPDGACDEDIHDGDYTFRRDRLAQRRVKELRGQPGYIDSAINKVLKEGPGKCNEQGNNPNVKRSDKRFEAWYFHGTITREEMGLLNAGIVERAAEDQEDFYAIITLINDTIIRATLNPLDSGRFPYNVFCWSRRAGHWAGVGAAEQVSMPQRMVNAATRAMLNNAGKSAGAQLVVSRKGITPADNDWTMTPDKIWYALDDGIADFDVRKAFMAVTIPNLGPQLMAIITYAFKLAEEATNIPLLSQGQPGERMPDTFGAAEMLNTNAHTLLRAQANDYDDGITEPLVNTLYEWLLLDDDVPNEEKGDFKINAHGSTALVERAIQEQFLLQVSQLAGNPAFGIDPKRVAAEILKSKRIEPSKVQFSKEEMEAMAKQPPAPPVQVAVAQIRAASAEKIQAADAQAEMQMHQAEQGGQGEPDTTRIQQEQVKADAAVRIQQARSDSEAARAQKEFDIAQQNGQLRIQELQLKKDLAVLEYSQKHQLTLEQVKADLAKTAIQEQTKKELSAAEIALADRQHGHGKSPSLVRDEMTTGATP